MLHAPGLLMLHKHDSSTMGGGVASCILWQLQLTSCGAGSTRGHACALADVYHLLIDFILVEPDLITGDKPQVGASQVSYSCVMT